MIPLSNPSISESDRGAVLEVLNTDTLSLGPKLDEFERLFAKRIGSRYAIAVNSGTSGLHLAIKAADVQPGDEVITTPFSFVASANCIMFENATPVFVDVDAETYNIDPAKIRNAISPRTKAILPVHVFGRPCDLSAMQAIAAQKQLTLIEDACEAVGATSGGAHVGTVGQTGVFAFYPNKQITTGEGGMIVTNDERIAMLCRSWRNQGRGNAADGTIAYERIGYNYRLSEFACALGIAQLARLDELLARRAALADCYAELLHARVDGVHAPAPAVPQTVISWFVYVVRLSDDFSSADRDAVLTYLRAHDIGCRVYFNPIHLEPFYRRKFGYGPGDFPVAEAVSERAIALPFFSDLAHDDVAVVCRTLADAIASVRGKGRRRHVVATVSADHADANRS